MFWFYLFSADHESASPPQIPKTHFVKFRPRNPTEQWVMEQHQTDLALNEKGQKRDAPACSLAASQTEYNQITSLRALETAAITGDLGQGDVLGIDWDQTIVDYPDVTGFAGQGRDIRHKIEAQDAEKTGGRSPELSLCDTEEEFNRQRDKALEKKRAQCEKIPAWDGLKMFLQKLQARGVRVIIITDFCTKKSDDEIDEEHVKMRFNGFEDLCPLFYQPKGEESKMINEALEKLHSPTKKPVLRNGAILTDSVSKVDVMRAVLPILAPKRVVFVDDRNTTLDAVSRSDLPKHFQMRLVLTSQFLKGKRDIKDFSSCGVIGFERREGSSSGAVSDTKSFDSDAAGSNYSVTRSAVSSCIGPRNLEEKLETLYALLVIPEAHFNPKLVHKKSLPILRYLTGNQYPASSVAVDSLKMAADIVDRFRVSKKDENLLAAIQYVVDKTTTEEEE